MEMNNLIITQKLSGKEVISLKEVIGKVITGINVSLDEQGEFVVSLDLSVPKPKPVALAKGKGVGKSQYRGVFWDKANNKWRAMIQVDGKRTHIGRFSSEVQAAIAYDKANYEQNGLKGWFNFPETIEYLHNKDTPSK